MIVPLSNATWQALRERPGEPMIIEDDQTHTVYVLVQQDLHQRAMVALRRQEDDQASVRRGLAQMEAGQGYPLAEVDADIRQRLGFSPRS